MRSGARTRGAPPPAWRAVPKVDLLERDRTHVPPGLARAGLGGLLLVAVALGAMQYRTLQSVQGDLDRTSARVAVRQKELTTRSSQAGQMDAQLRDLQQQLQGLEQVHQQLNAAKARWEPDLTALVALQGDGIEFRSMERAVNGDLVLVATGTDEQALALLHRGLLAPDQLFAVQTVQWQRDDRQFSLTATLRVAP